MQLFLAVRLVLCWKRSSRAWRLSSWQSSVFFFSVRKKYLNIHVYYSIFFKMKSVKEKTYQMLSHSLLGQTSSVENRNIFLFSTQVSIYSQTTATATARLLAFKNSRLHALSIDTLYISPCNCHSVKVMETLFVQLLQHSEQIWQKISCLTTIKEGGTLEREASVTLKRTDDTVQIKDTVKQAKDNISLT